MIYFLKKWVASFTQQDKMRHYIVSQLLFVKFYFGFMILNFPLALFWAFVSAFVVGLAVEVYDAISGKGKAEFGDIVANTAGILAIAFPIWIIT